MLLSWALLVLRRCFDGAFTPSHGFHVDLMVIWWTFVGLSWRFHKSFIGISCCHGILKAASWTFMVLMISHGLICRFHGSFVDFHYTSMDVHGASMVRWLGFHGLLRLLPWWSDGAFHVTFIMLWRGFGGASIGFDGALIRVHGLTWAIILFYGVLVALSWDFGGSFTTSLRFYNGAFKVYLWAIMDFKELSRTFLGLLCHCIHGYFMAFHRLHGTLMGFHGTSVGLHGAFMGLPWSPMTFMSLSWCFNGFPWDSQGAFMDYLAAFMGFHCVSTAHHAAFMRLYCDTIKALCECYESTMNNMNARGSPWMLNENTIKAHVCPMKTHESPMNSKESATRCLGITMKAHESTTWKAIKARHEINVKP